MNEPPSGAIYRADDVAGHIDGGWRPSIFMSRWASRISLEVTAVRIERLQEVSEEDAVAEGLRAQVGDSDAGYTWSGTGYEGGIPGSFHTPGTAGCRCNVAGPSPAQCAYRELWDSINGKRAPWSANPWVWVVEFRSLTLPRASRPVA
jgi:hypothetical protein